MGPGEVGEASSGRMCPLSPRGCVQLPWSLDAQIKSLSCCLESDLICAGISASNVFGALGGHHDHNQCGYLLELDFEPSHKPEKFCWAHRDEVAQVIIGIQSEPRTEALRSPFYLVVRVLGQDLRGRI